MVLKYGIGQLSQLTTTLSLNKAIIRTIITAFGNIHVVIFMILPYLVATTTKLRELVLFTIL